MSRLQEKQKVSERSVYTVQLTALVADGEDKKTQSFSSPLNSSSFDAYIVELYYERMEKNHDALVFLME